MNKKVLFASCSVSALALVLATASAQAQAPAQGVETVVVTGVQASVAGALELKQNSGQMIDSIVAEDIGKLPDTTVVESLQHVTGISIIRSAIEPNTVLIRGLPDIQTLVNGREIFTSTGRALNLADIPSELLASVNVNKTSQATDIEGGIAGLIDVRMHRPFDFKGEKFAVSGQVVTESLAKHIDPNVSALLSNRWNTDIGEMGLLVDVAYKNTHTRSDQITNQSPYQNNVIGPVPGAGNGPLAVCTTVAFAGCTPEPAGGAVASNIAAYTGGVLNGKGVIPGYAGDTLNTTMYETMGQIARANIVVSGQWKPSSNVQVYAEGYYTRLRNTQPVYVNVLLNYILPNPSASTVYPGTNIVSKSVSGGYSLTSDQDRKSNEDTFQGATGVDWAVTNNWEITSEVDMTLSKGSTVGIILDDTYNLPTDGMTMIKNYNGTGAHYTTQVGNPQENAGGIYADQLFDSYSVAKGSEWDWRIDSTYNFAPSNFVKDLVVGFRITARGANNNGYAISSLNCISNNNPTSFYNAINLAAQTSPVCGAPNTSSGGVSNGATGGYDYAGSGVAAGAPAYTTATTIQTKATYYTKIGGVSLLQLAPNGVAAQHTSGLVFGGKFGTTGWVNLAPQWGLQNIPTLRAAFGYANTPAYGAIAAGDYTKSGPPNNPATLFIVLETSKSGYFKADYGFDVFGFPVDGNVGLHFTDYTLTEQANNSIVSNGAVSFVPTVAQHETTILLPSWNLKATLMDNLFARVAVSETATRPSFSQLNPSTSYTLGGTTLQSSASSGNPNLSSVKSINEDADVEYYWGKANHVSVAGFHRYVEGYIQNQTSQVTQLGVVYNFTKPVNFQNSYIDGIEVGYSQFLDFLPEMTGGPDWLGGFGWDVNGTYISGVFNNITKWHYNAAGIYEYGNFSARVSYTWSSSYKINPQLTSGTQPNTEWAAPRANLDASINYKFDDHLTVTLDATNLNDGLYKAYDGANAAVGMAYYNETYARYDHTFSIGLRYVQ